MSSNDVLSASPRALSIHFEQVMQRICCKQDLILYHEEGISVVLASLFNTGRNFSRRAIFAVRNML